VEEQTLRLLEVCRSRGTPIITFINKLDREVREPVDLIDEIERVLGMAAVPFSWPIGMGKSFHGVYDLREDCIRVFKPGEDRLSGEEEVIQGLDHPSLDQRFGTAMQQARHDIELVRAATPEFSREQYLAGKQTPVFFGSAINNFGVREVLDALVDLAPPPRPRVALQGSVQPDRPRFSGVVFKIQANMDPAHRDRVVFVRVCSPSSAPARNSAPTTWCPSCRSGASCWTRPTLATSSASRPTAACSSATRSPKASRCSSPGCRSSPRRSSATSRW
jgi:peptide chain release factor 3